MVDLEPATSFAEWSYVAGIDSVRRSEGKSHRAAGWEVGEERSRVMTRFGACRTGWEIRGLVA